MRNYLLLFILLLSISLSAQNPSEEIITKSLAEYIIQNSGDEQVRVNIRLKEKLVAKNVIPRYATLDRSVRREAVVSAFKEASNKSKANLIAFLETKSNQSNIIYSFWITNVVTCMVSPEVINDLAKRNDIERIDLDQESNALIGVEKEYFDGDEIIAGEDEITYNVTKMNVPDIWELGYTGEGIIVAVLDTGVNYDHSDLEDHMWEDPDYPNHGWDFANNDDNPKDDHGHGSHCAGTVAGNGTAGSQTGMAPDAKIMALKILRSNGSGNESSGWAAIEFAIENGAHILSMSIGWTPAANPDRESWRNAHDNALAAGIIASVAAGNEGGSPSSTKNLRTPGDCPPPWLNPDQTLKGGISSVVCVGATDQADIIAGFSSRGPAEWEFIDPYNDYPFDPEMGLIRPDLSAPGVNIKSASSTNNNGYTTMSGTSMATPGVAGVMALLLSKNPSLTPEQITEILEITSVDLGSAGKDNVYGSGRVDALLAIETTPYPGGIVYSDHIINDESGNGNGEAEAGESILLSLEMFNENPNSIADVNVKITSNSPYLTLTDDEEQYGYFQGREAKTVTDGFAFEVATGTPGETSLEFDVESTSGEDVWYSNFTIGTYGPNVKLGTLKVDDSQKGNGNGVLDPGESADLIMMVHNYGQVGIEDLNIEINTEENLISIENSQQHIDSIPSGSQQMVVFAVNVDENIEVESFANFSFEVNSSAYSDTRAYTLGISFVVEDWESGTFDTFNWKAYSFAKWNIIEVNPFEGKFAAESTIHADNFSSDFVLVCDIMDSDSVSFYVNISSEEDHDFLRFFINNVKQDEWSGEQEWKRVAYPISNGLHTLKWEYSKDASGSEGDDKARVDFINLPVLTIPSVDAGADSAVCDSETYQLDASADNYTSVEWITSGDGTFNDNSIVNPVYTPGVEDIANMNVTLTLKAFGHSSNVADDMTLAFLTEPEKADTPTGDSELCINPGTTTYSTTLISNSTYQWEIEPTGAGITESNADTAVVVWNEEFTGIASIKVKEINTCGEGEFSDSLEVTVYDSPDVDLGEDQVLCDVENYELDAGNTGLEYLWSTGETTQKIIASGDGNTSFWVRVTTPASCSSADTVMLNFASSPIVNLGVDTLICRVSEIILDAGNEGSEYLWSTGETTQKIAIKGEDYSFGLQEYSCIVTNSDGCEGDDAIIVEILDCTGIEEVSGGVSLEVYPNPNNGKFQLKMESQAPKTLRVKVLSISGIVVYDVEQNIINGNQTHQIDLDGLSDGIYSVFILGDGVILNKKIVVRK